MLHAYKWGKRRGGGLHGGVLGRSKHLDTHGLGLMDTIRAAQFVAAHILIAGGCAHGGTRAMPSISRHGGRRPPTGVFGRRLISVCVGKCAHVRRRRIARRRCNIQLSIYRHDDLLYIFPKDYPSMTSIMMMMHKHTGSMFRGGPHFQWTKQVVHKQNLNCRQFACAQGSKCWLCIIDHTFEKCVIRK
jgi:hypothetical protein